MPRPKEGKQVDFAALGAKLKALDGDGLAQYEFLVHGGGSGHQGQNGINKTVRAAGYLPRNFFVRPDNGAAGFGEWAMYWQFIADHGWGGQADQD